MDAIFVVVALVISTIDIASAQVGKLTANRLACHADPNTAAFDSCESFNILSLDSSNYEAYVTASVLDYMERTAYYTARAKFCIDVRPESERISMVELYDVIAGSETGALIAGSLALRDKSEDPKYINKWWASDLIKHFDDHAKTLYVM